MKEHRQAFTPQGKTATFVVRVDGDTVNVDLNGEPVITDQIVEGLGDITSSRVAIGAKYSWDGSILTFRNLKIKKVEPEDKTL